MSNNYTTLEQSEKLLELGLSPETADMYWKKSPILNHKDRWIPHIINKLPILFDDDDIIPRWSLGTLLKLMPKTISVPVDERSAYFYNLEWQFANDNSLRYITTNRSKCLIDMYSDHDIGSKSFIETAFDMMVWLLENGYIKTENK